MLNGKLCISPTRFRLGVALADLFVTFEYFCSSFDGIKMGGAS